jgi:hypothetical protein
MREKSWRALVPPFASCELESGRLAIPADTPNEMTDEAGFEVDRRLHHRAPFIGPRKSIRAALSLGFGAGVTGFVARVGFTTRA